MNSATASRRGVRAYNCDAAAIHRHGQVLAAALVDGIGNSAEIADTARICAEVAARVGARRSALLGILSAAQVVAGPAGAPITPDGVAVLALAYPDGETDLAWTGDARAYGWDGDHLVQLTTDQNVGNYLRQNGEPEGYASKHDNWIRSSLGRSTIATVHAASTDASLVLLTSDGVHDQVSHETLVELLRLYADEPETLALAIVEAAEEDPDGYRDDATVIVLLGAASVSSTEETTK